MKEQILNDSRLLDQLAEMRGALDTKLDRTSAMEMIAEKPDKKEVSQDVKRQVSQMYVAVDAMPLGTYIRHLTPPLPPGCPK